MMTKGFLLSASIAALCLSSVAAVAQEAQPTGEIGFGEIVVTAQRRAQNVQDVGIAIAAFSGDQLKTMGVSSSLDVARLTPGVHISGSVGGQNSQFSIRGVTQNDFNDAIEAPVAVYVDDGYIPNLQGQTFGMFDIERVEVLKGPQGTLFGRNATGGLVHFVVRKPTDELDGYMEAGYGRYNNIKLEGAVGGPITDKVSARVSVFFNKHDEIMKNVYPQGIAATNTPPSPCCEDVWDDNTLAGRAQLQFTPTDQLTIRVTGSAARQNLSEAPYNNVGVIPVYDDEGRMVDAVYSNGPDGNGFTAPDKDKLEVSKDYALSDLNRTRAYNGALHVSYAFDDFDIVSITDFKRLKKNFSMDVDASPVNLVNFATRANTRSISEELRASGKTESMRWQAGLYYLDINAKADNGFLAPANSVFAGLFGMDETGVDLVNSFQLKTKSYSAFGQIEYDVAEKVTFILGGRIIREKQNYDFASFAMANLDDYHIETDTPLFQLQTPFTNKRSKTLWAGKAQIEYRPVEDLLLYVGVNRGVKGGSYNAKLPDDSPELLPSQIPYKPEELVSYEGGFKSTLADGRVILNGSIYYYDYSNYQAFTFSNVSGYVQNRDARTYGAEFDISVMPVDGLQASLSVSAFDSKVKDVEIAPGILRDVKPTFAPETQLSARISYELPTEVAGGKLMLGADGSYSSSFYHNIRNFQADKLDGYAVFNGQVTWTSNDEAWRFTAYVNNIFDKRYVTIGYNLAGLCGCNEESYGKPRWWGVTGTYKF